MPTVAAQSPDGGLQVEEFSHSEVNKAAGTASGRGTQQAVGLTGLELREEVKARHTFRVSHSPGDVEGRKLKDLDEEENINIRREQRKIKLGEEGEKERTQRKESLWGEWGDQEQAVLLKSTRKCSDSRRERREGEAGGRSSLGFPSSW